MRTLATSRVEACVSNHNTSEFAELALRTLVASHEQRLAAGQLRVTVVDNHSDGGLSDLVAAASELGATFQRSRWPAASAPVNSHGDVLRDFVAAHDQATHVFFVDADVVFTSPDPLGVMLAEMEEGRDVWAVQARFQWDEDKQGQGPALISGLGIMSSCGWGSAEGLCNRSLASTSGAAIPHARWWPTPPSSAAWPRSLACRLGWC
jgi:hypothetical protein